MPEEEFNNPKTEQFAFEIGDSHLKLMNEGGEMRITLKMTESSYVQVRF